MGVGSEQRRLAFLYSIARDSSKPPKSSSDRSQRFPLMHGRTTSAFSGSRTSRSTAHRCLPVDSTAARSLGQGAGQVVGESLSKCLPTIRCGS
jgi:hypothetical protein